VFASVICLFFITVPRSCSLSAEALSFRQVNGGLVQRFPSFPRSNLSDQKPARTPATMPMPRNEKTEQTRYQPNKRSPRRCWLSVSFENCLSIFL